MVVNRLAPLMTVLVLITFAGAIGVAGAATTASHNSFEVSISDIDTPVVEGETVEVEANITNTWHWEDTEQIHLKRNGTTVDSVKDPSLTLASGESTDVTLEWETEYGDAGPVELAVSSDEYKAVQTINVGEGPTFPVAIDSTTDPILGGESLTASVTVRNTGERTATTPVELSVANERQALNTVELAPGETMQTDLTWETTENDTGTHTVEVTSADAATESQVRISHSGDVVSGETAGDQTTEATENEQENTVMSKIVDLHIGVAAVLVTLLIIALVGYGLRRD